MDRVHLGGVAADADLAKPQRLFRVDDAVHVLPAALWLALAIGRCAFDRAARRAGRCGLSRRQREPAPGWTVVVCSRLVRFPAPRRYAGSRRMSPRLWLWHVSLCSTVTSIRRRGRGRA